jgi:1-phosphatidylinositol-3-phosphate 5-kinase
LGKYHCVHIEVRRFIILLQQQTDVKASSPEYANELMNMICARHPPGTPSAPLPSPAVTGTSFFSNTTTYKLFGSSSQHLPDPDQEGVVWHEPETYSAVITRKENPRDPTLLLSFRDVLRQKSSTDASGLPASVFSSLTGSASRAGSGLPPSAWAKPAVEVSRAAVDGEVSGLPKAGVAAGKILHDVEAVSASTTASSVACESNIRRGKASSIISVESDATAGPEGETISSLPPNPPSKDGENSSASSILTSDEGGAAPSTFANTLSSTLSNAVRYVLNSGETPPPPTPFKNHHGLLTTAAIDERPHIKHDWTIGKRLRFSCTVYYAKQFDALRRRCGIDDVFLKSLSRSANWAAEGGKSKSNFWKTSDGRFIIKTLVNAWNVADLCVLVIISLTKFCIYLLVMA